VRALARDFSCGAAPPLWGPTAAVEQRAGAGQPSNRRRFMLQFTSSSRRGLARSHQPAL